MGILSLFMSENKQKWFSQLNENHSKDFQYVILNFFIKDNISFNKYVDNQYANNFVEMHGSLEFYENLNNLSIEKTKMPNPTKTFKEFFCDDYYDRPMGIPNWLMLGYPEVSKWISENSESLESLFSKNADLIGQDGLPNYTFYRIIIDMYKKRYGKLECELQ